MPERHARLTSSTNTYLITGDAVIGSARDCQIVISSSRVAARHARIFFDAKRDGYFVEDLAGARNTWVDGEALNRPLPLGSACSVTLGDVELVFQVVEPSATSPVRAASEPAEPDPPGTDLLPAFEPVTPVFRDAPSESKQPAAPAPTERREVELPLAEPGRAEPGAPEPTAFENVDFGKGLVPVPEPAPRVSAVASTGSVKSRDETIRMSPAGFHLEIKSPPEVAGVYRLREGQSTVGKAADCEIRIDHWSMSRKHALLTVEAGRCRLQDLGSTNGTFVGHKRLDAEAVVAPDVLLTFGSVDAVLTLIPPG